MSDKIYISTKLFPVTEEQTAYLEECARGGSRPVELIWRAPEEMTAEDYASAAALMNFFPPQGVSQAKNLEWMQLSSAGADVFCKEGVLPENCVLTNGSGAYSLSVGEHMLAMTFALIRNFPQYKANQVEHVWKDEGRIISIEGATVAVLGMGDIGSFYARKMNALGARVIGVRRHEHPKPDYVEEQATFEQLDEVLPKADIVAMVLPGGEETRHLINDRTLALMKEGSFILNVGRGSSIDQEALCRALESGHIQGLQKRPDHSPRRRLVAPARDLQPGRSHLRQQPETLRKRRDPGEHREPESGVLIVAFDSVPTYSFML